MSSGSSRTGPRSRLIGAVLFEHNEAWATQPRCMQVEAFRKIDTAGVDPSLTIATQAPGSCSQAISQVPPP